MDNLTAISAGHELTLEVAKTILKEGGNAFDAAISAFMTMFITEPCMASAGGNGFALLKPKDQNIQFLDFFCQTPITKRKEHLDFFPVEVNFGTETEVFHIGMASAAVPGAVAAIFEIHEKLGTIPFKYLIQPVQELAKEGVLLNAFQAYDLELLAPIFWHDESVRPIFFEGDKVKVEGMKVAMPMLADFLEFLNDEGARGFYHGEIAATIAKDSKLRGGNLSRKDFEDYSVHLKEPLKIKWKNNTIHLPNGPSKGGIASALFFAHAENNPYAIATAIKTAQEALKKESELLPFFDSIYPNNNLDYRSGSSANKGTSHFNIMDDQGNAIALTSSIGEGSGYFIPGTQMQLNNMLGEIFLLPNGAHSWQENVRLNSMMTPTMITNQDKELSFIAGSGGASRIPYAIAQVIYDLYENNSSLIQATEKGRFHFQNNSFQVEGNAAWNGPKNEATFWDASSLYFGGVHSIQLKNKKVFAHGDKRRYGVAEVF